MTPTFFLSLAGTASLFIGVLGILSPQLSPAFWFDHAENIVHTGFGFVAYAVRFMSPRFQEGFILVVSLLTAFVAIGGIMVAGNPAPNFIITNLEHPIDNALHLTFVLAGLSSLIFPRMMRKISL